MAAKDVAAKDKGPANRPFDLQFCSLSDWPTYDLDAIALCCGRQRLLSAAGANGA